jgi:predicted DNA-binding protein with PD1-like motif
MNTLAVRLTEGQDLREEIEKLAKSKNLPAGVILSGVGSLSKAKIRLPVIAKDTRYIEVAESEINSLQGTLSAAGSHIHIVVSDKDGHVWGGHLSKGCEVRTTCELVIGVLDDQKFSRAPDKSTGFEELVIE